jgi:hypothetical protein
MGGPDKAKETERVLQLEKSKFEQAEEGRLQLQAQLNLIQKQLEQEDLKLERCRRNLEPEEQAKFEESKQSLVPRPQSLSISEKILLKYKRSSELCTMFEEKYQVQTQLNRELTLQSACQEGALQQREDRIQQLLDIVA